MLGVVIRHGIWSKSSSRPLLILAQPANKGMALFLPGGYRKRGWKQVLPALPPLTQEEVPLANARWSSPGLYSHCRAEPTAPCYCAFPGFITTGGGKIPELLLGFFWGHSNSKEEGVLCYRTTEMRTQLLTRPVWSHPAQGGPHKACQGSETRFPTPLGCSVWGGAAMFSKHVLSDRLSLSWSSGQKPAFSGLAEPFGISGLRVLQAQDEDVWGKRKTQELSPESVLRSPYTYSFLSSLYFSVSYLFFVCLFICFVFNVHCV